MFLLAIKGKCFWPLDKKMILMKKTYPVAIRTGPAHRSVFAIHTGSSLFLKFT